MTGTIRMTPTRPLRAALLIVLVLAGTLTGLAPPLLRVAEAQERRGLLDMLFGAPPQRRYYLDREPPRRIQRSKQRRQVTKPARTQKQRTERARAATPSSRAAPVPPPVVAKRDTARGVLVVGDFLAGSLAGGLDEGLADNPNLKVVGAADGSSGLVRDDHFDWIARIGPMIDKEKPAVVVAMFGANDRQPMQFAGATLTLRTPGWTAEYERRATAFAASVAEKKLPLIWVGAPSFKSQEMSADMAYLNEIYRRAATSAGGEFVDVWDGFVDAGGDFASSGPDISGQPARLRNADGITMTPAGAEKLAFFAEKPIFRVLGATATGGLGPDPDEPQAPARPKIDVANAKAAPLVALSDPALDGGDALLGGAAAAPAPQQPSPRDRLVLSGVPTAGEAGRADAFNRSGKSAAVVPRPPSDPVLFRGSVDIQQISKPMPIKPPAPMPSLSDAILDDWSRQSTGTAAEAAAPAAPKP